MNKILASFIVVIAINALPALAHDSSENPGCTLASLKGTYTFNAQGFNLISNTYVPSSYIGMVYFNGNGAGQAKWYFSGSSFSGDEESIDVVATNTYVMESNCHARVTYKNGKVFDYFVAPDGTSAQWAINYPETSRFSSEAKRISRSNLLLN